MCEFYDGCGHGDGPQSFGKSEGSCLQSLGCWGVFILCLVGFGSLAAGMGDAGGYVMIIGLITSGVIAYGVTYWIPEQFKKR